VRVYELADAMISERNKWIAADREPSEREEELLAEIARLERRNGTWLAASKDLLTTWRHLGDGDATVSLGALEMVWECAGQLEELLASLAKAERR